MMKIAPAFTGTVRLLSRRSVPMLMMIVLLGSMLSLTACDSDESDVVFPDQPKVEVRKWYFDVYGTGPNDVYVGGAQGVIRHFNGSIWEDPDNLGSTTTITKIWVAPTETDFYAVGHGGRIWRNTGSGWNGMSSGTSQNLYGLGKYQGTMHAVGANGTIRRLNGSSWGGVGSVINVLDENGGAIDTLSVTADLSSLVAVNPYFLGGAYFDPNFEGELFGTAGTKGTILAPNDLDSELVTGDWILRPISGDQRVEAEWVLCMNGDPDETKLDRNYLGTSEGWLFRLKINDDGDLVWQKFFPELTEEPGSGIRDIWLDDAGNVYAVTDEGTVVYQTYDYEFDVSGYRQKLHDGHSSLVSIWGSGPDNIYFTGYYDEIIFRASHVADPDPDLMSFTVETITLAFPNKSAGGSSLEPGLDEIGRPLR